MRPRIIHTKKILAVAVAVTTAACADRRPPAPTPEPPSIESASAPAPTPIEAAKPAAQIEAAQPAPLETAVQAARVAPARPRANRLSSNDLLALRSKLVDTPRDEALAHAPRFRPLCDADGYPLVGNLVRKGPVYTPSAFCKDLRDRGAR